MFKITDKNELLESFRNLDRDEVIPPDRVSYPLAVSDYLAWVEPSGARTYFIFKERESDQLLGLVFRRNAPPADGAARMCEWCHSVRGPSEIGLLSVAASPKQRLGISLCRDLGCKDRIMQPPRVNDLNESLRREEKVVRVLEKASQLARKRLL